MSKAMVGWMLVFVLGWAWGDRRDPSNGGASARLHALFERAWEFELREDPLLATSFGDLRYNDRLPSVGLEDQHRRARAIQGFLKELAAIPPEELSARDRMNREIFARWMGDRLEGYRYHDYFFPITNREGFHVRFPELPDHVPLQNVRQYEDYIHRLAAFKTYAEQHIELLRAGLKSGYTLPKVVLRGFESILRPQLVDQAEDSLLYQPFRAFPPTIPEADRARLREAGRRAIMESVVPGYREFLEFMVREYIPAARTGIAVAEIPRGSDYYRFLVRHYTTLDITPEEVHRIGLQEVARIRREMERVMRKTGFQGSFQEFIRFLRTDSRFYVDRPEQLLKEAAWILKRMDGQLPRLFGKLPRLPYGIREIPAYIAPKTTTAYYSPGSPDGRRAGYYYLNTYNLSSRPLYELEALSFHEAVPGHHLQIALQQELEDVPKFRKIAQFTVMVEGWALYAERLGLEAGFYQDPYSDFGRLSFEMWRALRLVVDTGIHAMGWSRQQAIETMAANSALTLANITNEVDRYIAWPGQALAYKMGELKIRQLRAWAEKELGERFDLRRFHDVVLGSGAVPLDVLEANVRDFVKRLRPQGSAETEGSPSSSSSESATLE